MPQRRGYIADMQTIQKTWLVITSLAIILTIASSAYLTRTKADTTPASRPAELEKLRHDRVDTLVSASDLALQLYSRGLGSYSDLLECDRLLLDAKLDAAESPKDRLQVLRDAKDMATDHEKLTKNRFNAGLVSDLDVRLAEAHRLDIEIHLLSEAGR